jgi:hypothetical protein
MGVNDPEIAVSRWIYESPEEMAEGENFRLLPRKSETADKRRHGEQRKLWTALIDPRERLLPLVS